MLHRNSATFIRSRYLLKGSLSVRSFTKDSAACGVALIVNLPNGSEGPKRDHQLVKEITRVVGDFTYRAGINEVTGESDGAGVRFYNLPQKFFQKKIDSGEFRSFDDNQIKDVVLVDGHFGVGQYFLSVDPANAKCARQLIDSIASENGLRIIGWRQLCSNSVNSDILSRASREKQPSLWQSIFLGGNGASFSQGEESALKTCFAVVNKAKAMNIPVDIVSHSFDSVVYKGMIRPRQIADFYLDLKDPDFTASAAAAHARFATNTDPQWNNAQPCPYFMMHNGELNSALSNAADMGSELKRRGFSGIFPGANLSDSMQFDADLANQVAMKKLGLEDAFLRLMPPLPSRLFSEEANAMLKYHRLERTPYNGPAFMVGGIGGNFIAALDVFGLRPSRHALVRLSDGGHQFHAASDEYLGVKGDVTVLSKGHLEPGGVLLITKQGEILKTKDVLERALQNHTLRGGEKFSSLLSRTMISLPEASPAYMDDVASNITRGLLSGPQQSSLNRLLYSAGWDHESIEQVVRPMALNGSEPIAAMGNDINPLPQKEYYCHISYFFHQLFAQVSAPPLDSIKERDRFNLTTSLGPLLGAANPASKVLSLSSPFLKVGQLGAIINNTEVPTKVLDTSFAVGQTCSAEEANTLLSQAIIRLVSQAATTVRSEQTGILILSDKGLTDTRMLIPDVMAVAAVRQHLEAENLIREASIVMDTYQVNGPHHASLLLAIGAKAVYPRGAYKKVGDLFGHDDPVRLEIFRSNYNYALVKCLLKTMGKMGITDVNNYINGKLVAALGINLSTENSTLPAKLVNVEPSLSNIFPGIYSPMKGIDLKQIAGLMLERRELVIDKGNDFSRLPRSGFYMPEKKGMQHGFGPVVVNAFTDWLKDEELRLKQWQLHYTLEKQGLPDFVDDNKLFTAEKGFLDSRKADEITGKYPVDYLESLNVSPHFTKMMDTLNKFRNVSPTGLKDYLAIDSGKLSILSNSTTNRPPLQSVSSILNTFYGGSMSQGALTVTDPKNPTIIGTHETLTAAMNAIGMWSASGEGGEAPQDIRNPRFSSRCKQIASGRFGTSAMQIGLAEELEIKMAQGAKPGEGGELPGHKVSVRFAAQRGGLPGTDFISPPPHHDIYSIEDLAQLIHDIKTAYPNIRVAVKLVASQGIGTIATGVAKAGADIINIAGNSGGTGAAQQSSIKHSGLPAELGLAEVHKALSRAGLRDMVQLRVSGGFKTAEDVIISAILGGDLFEFGTVALLTQGCKMLRLCFTDCTPGLTTHVERFKGNQRSTELYFANLAKATQLRLAELGVSELRDLRGRTELLTVVSPSVATQFDFSVLLSEARDSPFFTKVALHSAQLAQKLELGRTKEDAIVKAIHNTFAENPKAEFKSDVIDLDTQDRSFASRIAGTFAKHLEKYPSARILIRTTGAAGQSYGFVAHRGLELQHEGTVQDGSGKSLCGGVISIKSPSPEHAEFNTIAGNAALYGASSGMMFVNGLAGHRFGILMKGAQVVVEGTGDFAFEYITSGTGLVLGPVGPGFCNSALGGIVIAHKDAVAENFSDAVRVATIEESQAYEVAVMTMLQLHLHHTGSVKASRLLDPFVPSDFNVLIPKELDKYNTPKHLIDVMATYKLRQVPLTSGMEVWLRQKLVSIFTEDNVSKLSLTELGELRLLKEDTLLAPLFSPNILKYMRQRQSILMDMDFKKFQSARDGESSEDDQSSQVTKLATPVEERLRTINGELDERYLDAIRHIRRYVSQLHRDAEGCSGCRAQSCSGGENVDFGCPGGKSINTINSFLKRLGNISEDGILTTQQWTFLRQAFEVQIESSPFIAYTGAACPAPCQDACTETIPDRDAVNSKDKTRRGKLLSEAVHIKDIEFHLYQVGRAMGWFDGKKVWNSGEIPSLFGADMANLTNYYSSMAEFKPIFRKRINQIGRGNELIIVGSGPAGMQLAFEALRDGMRVSMYERSDRPGGLLMDGIPAHKFDKVYLQEDFERLIDMGLELYVNSEVHCDPNSGEFYCTTVSNDASDPRRQQQQSRNRRVIASSSNKQQYVALCIGAGKPRSLPAQVTEGVDPLRLVSASEFLKATNDLATTLARETEMSMEERESLIKKRLGHMDPRGKKIVVVGGGDTAQDVLRWVSRYFNEERSKGNYSSKLMQLVRGPKVGQRGIKDGYPALSGAPTKENLLLAEEIEYIQGDMKHLVEPTRIVVNEKGRLEVDVKQSSFKYQEHIEKNHEMMQLARALPRELRPVDPHAMEYTVHDVDFVICALGNLGKNSVGLVRDAEAAAAAHGNNRLFFAGDIAGVEEKIIIGAQTNASSVYGQIKAKFMKNTDGTDYARGSY